MFECLRSAPVRKMMWKQVKQVVGAVAIMAIAFSPAIYYFITMKK